MLDCLGELTILAHADRWYPALFGAGSRDSEAETAPLEEIRDLRSGSALQPGAVSPQDRCPAEVLLGGADYPDEGVVRVGDGDIRTERNAATGIDRGQ
jgi:hypothetical protein